MCQTVHSNWPQQTPQAHTITQCPWPRFRTRMAFLILRQILALFKSSLALKCFSEAVIAASVKPCIVIVLDTLEARTITQCPWPSFHAPVALPWFYVESSIEVCFSEAVIALSVRPCIVIVLDILFKHALWPSALDLYIALEWLYDFMWSLAWKCYSLQQW